jgi:hypothetical protein
MNVADWFVVGLVESATRLNHDKHKLNKATEKMKIAALRAIGQQKV